MRVRSSQNRDTPPPADTALGENPPTGALIDYWLPAKANKVVLEIRQGGNLVRHYASDEKDDTPEAERYFEADWTKPPQQLSAAAGAHRALILPANCSGTDWAFLPGSRQ